MVSIHDGASTVMSIGILLSLTIVSAMVSVSSYFSGLQTARVDPLCFSPFQISGEPMLTFLLAIASSSEDG